MVCGGGRRRTGIIRAEAQKAPSSAICARPIKLHYCRDTCFFRSDDDNDNNNNMRVYGATSRSCHCRIIIIIILHNFGDFSFRGYREILFFYEVSDVRTKDTDGAHMLRVIVLYSYDSN